jgi:hypothetical protein
MTHRRPRERPGLREGDNPIGKRPEEQKALDNARIWREFRNDQSFVIAIVADRRASHGWSFGVGVDGGKIRQPTER